MAKKSVLIFSVFVIILSIILPLFPINSEVEIYENTLRLHVLANSDREQDQALKLNVRNEILKYFSQNEAEINSPEKAYDFAKENIFALEAAAKKTIAQSGYDYDVKVTLSNEFYPTKEYKDIKMPSGYYNSLRVLIGEAEGHNWWCVLYPPLCTGSGEVSRTLTEAGFSRSQINILSEDDNPKYVARFKILEFFEQIFS